MNTRLKDSLDAAERALPPEGKEQLAELIELFIANFSLDPDHDFTPEERAKLAEIAVEPFEEADPEEVAAFFAKHGA